MTHEFFEVFQITRFSFILLGSSNKCYVCIFFQRDEIITQLYPHKAGAVLCPPTLPFTLPSLFFLPRRRWGQSKLRSARKECVGAPPVFLVTRFARSRTRGQMRDAPLDRALVSVGTELQPAVPCVVTG